MTTGQEGRDERIGNTVERPDAACRHFRPAFQVARGGPSAAVSGSTVFPDTLFAARRRGRAAWCDRDPIGVKRTD
jgi:hypothetical protein